jgi:hypothetical protein
MGAGLAPFVPYWPGSFDTVEDAAGGTTPRAIRCGKGSTEADAFTPSNLMS